MNYYALEDKVYNEKQINMLSESMAEKAYAYIEPTVTEFGNYLMIENEYCYDIVKEIDGYYQSIECGEINEKVVGKQVKVEYVPH